MTVRTDAEEKELQDEFMQVYWFAVFLMLDSSDPIVGVDFSGRKKEIQRALQRVVAEYASTSAAIAVSTWKGRYSRILLDATQNGQSSFEAIQRIQAESLKMTKRVRVAVHDSVMNAFREALSETGRKVGALTERYHAMPDADTLCSPYRNVVFAVGQGPIPPIHKNCRCIRVPEVPSGG